jgi:hypothetical protein
MNLGPPLMLMVIVEQIALVADKNGTKLQKRKLYDNN